MIKSIKIKQLSVLTLGDPLAAAFLLFMLGAPPLMAGEGGIWDRETLTGEWGGARQALSGRGIEIGLGYTGETVGVVSGGLQREWAYAGVLDLSVDADLERLAGWRGGSFHVQAFQIHNAPGPSADFTGSLADPSNINALRTTRLYTLWFEQAFGTGHSLRVGQLAADDEFFNSDTAGGLINGTFGWANLMSANLPSAGVAYPLAAPGARLRLDLSPGTTLLAGAFAGDPAGDGCYDADPDADPQKCNEHGTVFSFSGGTFWIAELQRHADRGEPGLSGSWKLGAWYHNGTFADQRFGLDAAGSAVTLAAAPGAPLNHHGNWGIYGVADQTVWRGERASLSLFARGGAVPSDRNLISWYVDAGAGIAGLFAGREEDILTLGVAHSHISGRGVALDRDALAIGGPPMIIRDSETVIELSYIAQLTPWWTLQPDLQYILQPGGNVPNPDNPDRRIEDALVVGLRTALTF